MSQTITILREMLLQIANEKQFKGEIKIHPITSDGANYTSHLFSVKLTAPGEKDVNLFAKVAAFGENMRQMSPNNIYETEMYFYNVLLHKYKNLEEKYDIPEKERLKTPIFYGCNNELYKETIVFEDLTASGFRKADRLKPMSREFVFNGVSQLARLHALSIAFGEHCLADFKETEEIFKKPKDGIIQFINNMIDSVIEATNEDHKILVSDFIKKVLDKGNILEPYKVPVIAHGDYKGCNLMYKVDDDDFQMVMLDFQVLHMGSVVTDLLYFILSGADRALLETYFDALLDHYYQKLRAALIRFNISPDSVYSRADFDDELQEKIKENVALGFCILLMTTVEADQAPKVDRDLEVHDFKISPNDRYKERLNGIVDFFIKRGIMS